MSISSSVQKNVSTSKLQTMPRVGSRHFSYTKKGRLAARKLAKKTGKKVKNKKR